MVQRLVQNQLFVLAALVAHQTQAVGRVFLIVAKVLDSVAIRVEEIDA